MYIFNWSNERFMVCLEHGEIKSIQRNSLTIMFLSIAGGGCETNASPAIDEVSKIRSLIINEHICFINNQYVILFNGSHYRADGVVILNIILESLKFPPQFKIFQINLHTL